MYHLDSIEVGINVKHHDQKKNRVIMLKVNSIINSLYDDVRNKIKEKKTIL